MDNMPPLPKGYVLVSAYTQCGRWADDAPGARADCDKKIKQGQPCEKCPDSTALADQMHAYARAYAEQRCAPLVEALQALLTVAHQEFDGVPGFGGELMDTPGNRAISIARAALAAQEKHHG